MTDNAHWLLVNTAERLAEELSDTPEGRGPLWSRVMSVEGVVCYNYEPRVRKDREIYVDAQDSDFSAGDHIGVAWAAGKKFEVYAAIPIFWDSGEDVTLWDLGELLYSSDGFFHPWSCRDEWINPKENPEEWLEMLERHFPGEHEDGRPDWDDSFVRRVVSTGERPEDWALMWLKPSGESPHDMVDRGGNRYRAGRGLLCCPVE